MVPRRVRHANRAISCAIAYGARGLRRCAKLIDRLKQALHWIVLAAGLGVTAAVTYLSLAEGRADSAHYFDQLVNRKIRELGAGISAVEQHLFSAAGLFGVGQPTAAQWSVFVAGLTRKDTPASLVELGYAQMPAAVAGSAAAPQMPGPATVKLTATFSGRSPTEAGAALGARPEIAEAIARAQVDGLPALSRKIEGMPGRTGEGPGAFLVLPVRDGARTGGNGTRTLGYVFAAVRLDELAAQVSRADAGYFRLRAYQGRTLTADSMIFAPKQSAGRAQFSKVSTTVLAGQGWTLEFDSTPALDAFLETGRPWWIFTGGLAGSLMLFGLTWSLMRTRSRAAEIAERMTRELSDQVKFSEDLVELNPNPMFRKDIDGRYVSFNRAWERLTGRNRSDWIGKRNDEVPALEQSFRHTEQDQNLIANPERVDRHETKIIAKDGHTFDVIVSKAAVRRADGTVVGIIGTVTDFTEAKRLAEELASQRELLELVNQSAQAGVWDQELPDGRAYYSPRYCDMLGYPQDADIGQALAQSSLLHPEDVQRVESVRAAHFARQRPYFDCEYRLRRADGTYLWVMGRGVAAFSADGAPQRFTGSIIDIAERKQAEFNLIEANQRAMDAAQAKSAFLATMSHEIRTPLNGVLGSAGLLLDTPLTSDQRDYVDTISLSGDQLLVVINDILDFSKIESGHMELEDLPLEVAGMIEDAFELVGDRARRKNLSLLYEIEPGVPPFITGDITRLRQVLMNLAGNSLKFTETGEVRIVCKVAERGTDDLLLQFAVRDTGIGIPADKIGRLFNAFTQVDASTTRKYGGTGLGLAICRRLVELMGGTIHAESEFGKGTCFIFTVRTRAVDRQAPQRRIREKDLLPHQVLLVDDYPANLRILAAQCAGWGLTTAATDDARKALTMLEEAHAAGNPFAAIISDMSMPGMDGIELAEAVAQHRERHKVQLPVIILSSAPRSETLEGRVVPPDLVSAYLLKPARQSQIFNALQDTLAPDRSVQVIPGDALPRNAPLPEQTGDLAILLAEDNEVNAKLAQKMLEKLGRAALRVDDGLKAVEAALARSYDCVLMDVQMPGIDGLEATRRIRAQVDLTRQPYIIAMTANAMAGDREMCLNAGMDDYVSKPIQMRTLAEALVRAAAFKLQREQNYPVAEQPAGQRPEPGAKTSVAQATGSAGQASAAGSAAASPKASAASGNVAVQTAPSAALDMEQVGELIDLDDTLAVLADFVNMFTEQSPARLAALRSAFVAGDFEEVGRVAHNFKGACANLGAVRAAEVASLLERAGRDRDGSAMAGWIDDLDARYAEARDALHVLVRKK